MCLVKKQKQYLENVKQEIKRKINSNFQEYIDDNTKEPLSDVLISWFGIDQKDIKEIVVSIDQKLTELNFYNHIRGKNKHELELLKMQYKKESLLCNNLYVSFESTLSMTILFFNTVLPVMAILVALVTAYTRDILAICLIFIYIIYILCYSIIQISRFIYHIKSKNLTTLFNNIMESCILDIDKRLYEIENRINMEGYNTYMVNIKPENKMGGSDK